MELLWAQVASLSLSFRVRFVDVNQLRIPVSPSVCIGGEVLLVKYDARSRFVECRISWKAFSKALESRNYDKMLMYR